MVELLYIHMLLAFHFSVVFVYIYVMLSILLKYSECAEHGGSTPRAGGSALWPGGSAVYRPRMFSFCA